METKSIISGRQIRVQALLPAPVELVWKVWTEAGHIAQWWGPEGFTNTIQQMDLVPGGEWRLAMTGPDGKRYPNSSAFVAIIPLQKIVFQHYNPDYLATVTFEPMATQTAMNWIMEFPTVELLETVVRVFKADQGLQQNVVRLEQYLLQQQDQV